MYRRHKFISLPPQRLKKYIVVTSQRPEISNGKFDEIIGESRIYVIGAEWVKIWVCAICCY